jgi:hypothetical protein
MVMEIKVEEKMKRAVRLLSINEPALALSETGVNVIDLQVYINEKRQTCSTDGQLWFYQGAAQNLSMHFIRSKRKGGIVQ